MMNSIKDFFARLKDEPRFREKYTACRSFDEVRDLAGAEGYAFSEEEFKKTLSLGFEDLSFVSGGGKCILDWTQEGVKIAMSQE